MDAMRSLGWIPAAAGSATSETSLSSATTERRSGVRVDPAQLARIAHDLRSPLTVLVCNRRDLRERHDDESTREILEDDELALVRLESIVSALEELVRQSK